jgi:hypothetical protein
MELFLHIFGGTMPLFFFKKHKQCISQFTQQHCRVFPKKPCTLAGFEPGPETHFCVNFVSGGVLSAQSHHDHQHGRSPSGKACRTICKTMMERTKHVSATQTLLI